jgi:hypothetical protein
MRARHAGLAAALAAALALNLAAWGARSAAQSDAGRAGLIVQFKDGSVVTRCVAIDSPDMTGYDLLRRADLPVVVEAGSMGVTVCKIGGDGCDAPAQPCFCECQDLGGACAYWIYFVAVEGKWRYSILGAAGQKVADRSVHGWIWGAGKSDGADVAPPLLTFEQICEAQLADAPPAAATATETVVAEPAAATALPTAPADATESPGATPGATPSAVQSAAPGDSGGGLLAFVILVAGIGAALFAVQRRAGKGGRRE